MPLPLIIGIGAAIAGIAGVGVGVNSGVKMKDAKNTMEVAKNIHDKNMQKFEAENIATSKVMDNLGEVELNVLKSFEEFSEIWSKIHNKPNFKNIDKGNIRIADYSAEDLIEVSVGAGVLLGSLGGAAVGTAGGFAAAGATTAAVTALGTASTGTAIAGLSGAAATNATLAALGGGAVAAGGGGVALGTTILGASTLGVGLLIGGIIFSIAGKGVSDKADSAWSEVKQEEITINELCEYLDNLKHIASDYTDTIERVKAKYQSLLENLKDTIVTQGKTDWNIFSDDEKVNTENMILVVGLLYEMCKVRLVIAEDGSDKCDINFADITKMQDEAQDFLSGQ